MLRTLAVSGSQCLLQEHSDIWGEALEWGGEHHTATAAECCAACYAHRRAARERGALPNGANTTVCNVFVHCTDPVVCGIQHNECWLKHNKALPPPPTAPPGSRGKNVGWTSGVVYEVAAELPRGLAGGTLTLHATSTLHSGPIRIALRPDLAPASVRELRRMAAGPTPTCNSAIGGCGHFYRSEHHFLLQGVIRSPGFYVATPRHEAPAQQMVMERGLVCWAGGMGGPDLFINLVDNAGFKDSHLCFGKITDDMPLVDAIVGSPLKPKAKPNDMTFLDERVHFTLSLTDAPKA